MSSFQVINDDNSLYKRLLRFLRLYSKGVFNQFDRDLRPELELIVFSFEDQLKVKTLPSGPIEEVLQKNMNLMRTMLPNKLNQAKDLIDNGINLLNVTKALIDQAHLDQNEHLLFSDFSMIDDFLIITVTHLKASVINEYYQLKNPGEGISPSLLEATFQEYILDINKLLYTYSKGDYSKSLDFNDTLRRASKRMLKVLGKRGLIDPTYANLNKISSLHYEGKSIRGKILYTQPQLLERETLHPNIDIVLELTSKVPITNYRHVRKLLETAKGNLYLLSDGQLIHGVGRITGNYNMSREDLFVIEFSNYLSWELRHFQEKLMEVSHDKVSLPKDTVNFYRFRDTIKRVYTQLKNEQVQNIYQLILAASKQPKGALVVISKNALSEAKRLASQCFLIEPMALRPSDMDPITSIDGAILMDLDGICYGIGAILDGMATRKGDTSRGARYNSAIRYVETISKASGFSDCIAVVISEDGIIDIITSYTL